MVAIRKRDINHTKLFCHVILRMYNFLVASKEVLIVYGRLINMELVAKPGYANILYPPDREDAPRCAPTYCLINISRVGKSVNSAKKIFRKY